MHVWIVEMKSEKTGKWVPTIGIGLTRDDAMYEKYLWERDNPDDQFRIRKYFPEKKS